MTTLRHLAGILLGLLLFQGQAHAVLTIEITQGVEGALPVAVVPFAWEGAGARPDTDVAAVISADLNRSGRFRPLPAEDMLARPSDAAQVQYADWRVLGIENLVVGRILPRGDGSYEVRFQLLDVFRANQLIGYSINARPNELRRAAHYISDLIYEKLTGEPGAFDTRIAYVTVQRPKAGETIYTLQVADSDGYGPRTVLTSREPIMSPSWSPDGRRLAYVSFESKRSAIYLQDVASGARERVTDFPGINGAPSWSPDGQRLALTLSKDGNPEIYVLYLTSKRFNRLTNNLAIDTEPSWAPDGQSLLFTSDRGGSPQIYRMWLDSGRVQRVTFEGSYNASGSFSADGKRIAMVHGDGRRFHIAVQDVDSGALQVLTDTTMDESPSFAPNGSMVIYATQRSGGGVLAATSVDGRVKQRLLLSEGEVREPAWSPFRK